MAGRRLLLFVVLLIAIGAVANSTVPREGRAPERRPAPAPAAPPQTPPVANVVVARLPGRKDVRATVGDVVQVEVSHDAADVVQVAALGLSEPVEPDIAAQLVFDADRAGRFAITLRDAQQRVGTIDVREAG
jgi:Na+-transporting methylmalonyl-CoA/oxaloacetate decarboxylase gamma subunit